MAALDPTPEPSPVTSGPTPEQIRRAERRAYTWYALFAFAALVGLAAIWPKYMARRDGLYMNYEGRERAHEYRVDQRRKAISEAESAGVDVPKLGGLSWPVILAGGSVALPLVALVLSLCLGRPGPVPREPSPPPEKGDSPSV